MPEAVRDIGIATVGWHCLLCGEIVDRVILQNRTRPLQTSAADEEMTEWHSGKDETDAQSDDGYCLEPVSGSTLA